MSLPVNMFIDTLSLSHHILVDLISELQICFVRQLTLLCLEHVVFIVIVLDCPSKVGLELKKKKF